MSIDRRRIIIIKCVLSIAITNPAAIDIVTTAYGNLVKKVQDVLEMNALTAKW